MGVVLTKKRREVGFEEWSCGVVGIQIEKKLGAERFKERIFLFNCWGGFVGS